MNQALSASDVEHFLEKGYVKIEGAFPRDVAEQSCKECFRRLGYSMEDKTTWKEARIHMGGDKYMQVKEFAPRVHDAICELSGGEDRVAQPLRWSDHFIVNLGIGADDPWQPAHQWQSGWHKDGDFFRHFLDSPEQGLLVFVNWTEVVHQGGPTYIATDSVPIVARFLADHPEGVLPGGFDFKHMISQCRQFEEAVGNPGDVFLLHPFMLHAASQNILRRIRIITNPPVHLKEPMRFDRENPEEFSAVERAILRGLGVERLQFRPAADREHLVPERVRRQQMMMEEEKARAAAAASS